MNRRRFLGTIGTLGAGLVAGPQIAQAATPDTGGGGKDAKIQELEHEVASLQAEIASLKGGTTTQIELGIWPGRLPAASFVVPTPGNFPGRDTDQLAWWESYLPRPFSMYRERGSVGQFDAPMIKQPEDFIAHHFSGNLNFRTGPAGNKTGVPYADVLAGNWDSQLATWGSQLAALTVPGINEIQSEANIGHEGAQPSAGTPAEYQQVAPYVRTALRTAGAVGIAHGMSLTRRLFQSDEWEQYYWPDADFIAADGYRVAAHADPTSVADFQGAIDVALQVGKPLYITEIGSTEPDKDQFYTDLLAFCQAFAGAPLAGIVLNLSADGPSAFVDPPGWAPVTSATAQAAFDTLINDPVFL